MAEDLELDEREFAWDECPNCGEFLVLDVGHLCPLSGAMVTLVVDTGSPS